MKAYAEYIDAWRQRISVKNRETEIEKKKALLKARKAAVFLVKKYDVDKVVLFGSLIKETYQKDSDIDIAVAGLAPKDFFRALVEVEEFIGAKIDLKPIEECRGLIKNHIEKGLTLYEKKS